MQSGFGIVYSNRLEQLADALIQWCASHPLPSPLEQDIVLVQSNGMADWLKLRQAEAQGISASMRYPMPASYLWELYQQVLDPVQLQQVSPYQKSSLQWRIFRLLPALLARAEFARPRQFLQPSGELDGTRLFQLARRLADLFDQYQLYRGDWLLHWEKGQACSLITDAGQRDSKSADFAADEAWQALLWQALVRDIGSDHTSRAQLHEQFKASIRQARPGSLPRRIMLFGINSLPAQLLDTLYLLSHHCQLMLFVLTPCEAFWEDKYNGGHPLLDAWGARGRDFIRLLREEHDRQTDSNQLQRIEAELFDDSATHTDNLLSLVQRQLQHNQASTNAPEPLPANPGIHFYPAYSRQREVEVLHDRILSLLASDNRLGYRDFIVMVPDIEQYAPHIEAVFSRYSRFVEQDDGSLLRDKRHLDYAISDRNPLTRNTLFQALDYLLTLPQKRLTLSEVFSLLEQPAIRQRFHLDQADLEQLQQWAEKGAIRWGFNSQHKLEVLHHQADNTPDWQNNTWQQGFDRLLAGYCAGDAKVWGSDETPVINLLAIDEVTANQGDLLGRFYQFVNQLHHWQQGHLLDQSLVPNDATSHNWKQRFNQLLGAFFLATDDADDALLEAIQRALDSWLDDCHSAGFNDALPLAEARTAWMDKIEQAGLSQKLSFNGITFCTLMPMRALPFQHVFLLGMNDGDYPRDFVAPDFDLMQYHYLAGDRDRRGDDQYLFLEALLSARQSLSISWVGKSIVDGSTKEPSVMVNQLRDYLDKSWTTDSDTTTSDLLTQRWPLTGFSRHYFEQHSTQRTYASEWLQLHQHKPPVRATALDWPDDLTSLSLSQLEQLIKQPVQVFFRDRLGVFLQQPQNTTEDDEPFEMDARAKWQLRDGLLDNANEPAAYSAMLARSGNLPAGAFAHHYIDSAEREAQNIAERRDAVIAGATPLEPLNIALTLNAQQQSVALTGQLDQRWQGNRQVFTTASHIGERNNPRLDKLAKPWLAHLVANAKGLNTVTHFIGLSSSLTLPPLSASAAQHQLDALFDVYLDALKQPLAITAKTAAAYLKRRAEVQSQDLSNEEKLAACKQAVKSVYDGSYNHAGEGSKPAISRAFDDFECFWQQGDAAFQLLAQRLYQPMLDALGKQETADET